MAIVSTILGGVGGLIIFLYAMLYLGIEFPGAVALYLMSGFLLTGCALLNVMVTRRI